MPFSKSFPKQSKTSTYPQWEEVTLTDAEEKEAAQKSREENIKLFKECINDAKSILIEKGLNECEKVGHGIVFVLGHPEFYGRFGFSPSKPYGLRSEYDVPDDVFMVKEIRKGALAGRNGIVKYRPEFSSV